MTTVDIVQMLVTARNDQEWFSSNADKLKEEYDNHFVAIHNKKIVDDDVTIEGLMQKLQGKKIDSSNVLVKFVSKIKLVL